MKNMHRKLTLITAVLIIVSTHAAAQNNGVTPSETPVTNEYRFTQIYTKPINKKFVLFAYTGYTKSPDFIEDAKMSGVPERVAYETG